MVTRSVVVNKRRLGPFALARELTRASRVGSTPETVFRLFRPFHGPEFDRIYARVMADETGRRILTQGQSLHPLLLDADRLRSLPEGTLGYEYQSFMARNRIDIVSFAEASLRYMARENYATDEAWALANRLRDIHEIVHVISGYETDLLGEMCELAFMIREDPRPKASMFAIRFNISLFRRSGYDHGEAAIQQAFERGRHVGLMVGADWDGMIDWKLDAVRTHLDIPEVPSYRPIPGEGEIDLPEPTLTDFVRGVLGANSIFPNLAAQHGVTS